MTAGRVCGPITATNETVRRTMTGAGRRTVRELRILAGLGYGETARALQRLQRVGEVETEGGRWWLAEQPPTGRDDWLAYTFTPVAERFDDAPEDERFDGWTWRCSCGRTGRMVAEDQGVAVWRWRWHLANLHGAPEPDEQAEILRGRADGTDR